MYCFNCGAKNENSAKFCQDCGQKLEVNNKKENKILVKFKNLSKKTKTIITIVAVAIIIAAGTLYFYLNVPKRVVERHLNKFFETSERESLGKVKQTFRNNKNKDDVIDELTTTLKNVFDSWIDEYNKSYDSEEKLEKAYEKYTNLFNEIIDYFEDSDYMPSLDTYTTYKNKVYELYKSKKCYLKGESYKKSGDDYNVYYYFKEVKDYDSYYSDVKDFISEYLKDEIEKFKNKVNDKVKELKEDATIDEIIKYYIEKLKIIKDNGKNGNVDISLTEEYKSYVKECIDKILENINKLVENKKDDEINYGNLLKYIYSTMQIIDKESEDYKTLDELYKKYEEKKPSSLIDQKLVDYDWSSYGSVYSKKINDIEYEGYLYFSLVGKNVSRTYNIDEKFKKLRFSIIHDSSWTKDMKGTIVIYGDNKEIYKSKEVNKSTDDIKDVSVDVSGVKELKIELQTESKAPSIYTSNYIYLVEPYLYK